MALGAHDAVNDEPEWPAIDQCFESRAQAWFLAERRAEYQRKVRPDQRRLTGMVLRSQAPECGVVSLAQERPGDDVEHVSRSSWPYRRTDPSPRHRAGTDSAGRSCRDGPCPRWRGGTRPA